jgi:hypothetical protein
MRRFGGGIGALGLLSLEKKRKDPSCEESKEKKIVVIKYGGSAMTLSGSQ